MKEKRARLLRTRNAAAPFASALIVVLFGAITYGTMLRQDESMELLEHTHVVLRTNRQILMRMLDAETGERGFVITGDSTYLQPYHRVYEDVHARLLTLQASSDAGPSQQSRIQLLGTLIDHRLQALEERIESRRTYGFDSARVAIVRAVGGKPTMDSMRVVSAEIEAAESALLDARARELAAYQKSVLWIVGLGTLLAAALATLINLTLSRYSATQERLNRELERQRDQLEEHTTELEMLNEALEERTAEAEEANQSKSKFLAAMSHDLRTPLTAIIGYTELMEMGLRGPVTERQLSDLERIRRSSRYLSSLINQVLAFAKIEAGHVDLRLEPVSISQVLNEIGALFGPQVKAKGLELGYEECDPALRASADRDKLDQILVNLITNAIKFTEPGGAIHIGCTTDGRSVQIEVRDSGRGIPAAQLENIFGAFVQLNGDGPPEGGQGVGLGLAISRELARAMKGELAAQSLVGRGSTFTLRLPLAKSGAMMLSPA